VARRAVARIILRHRFSFSVILIERDGREA
jgi:hypothetical protein